jgi:hypothetical protein
MEACHVGGKLRDEPITWVEPGSAAVIVVVDAEHDEAEVVGVVSP